MTRRIFFSVKKHHLESIIFSIRTGQLFGRGRRNGIRAWTALRPEEKIIAELGRPPYFAETKEHVHAVGQFSPLPHGRRALIFPFNGFVAHEALAKPLLRAVKEGKPFYAQALEQVLFWTGYPYTRLCISRRFGGGIASRCGIA